MLSVLYCTNRCVTVTLPKIVTSRFTYSRNFLQNTKSYHTVHPSLFLYARHLATCTQVLCVNTHTHTETQTRRAHAERQEQRQINSCLARTFHFRQGGRSPTPSFYWTVPHCAEWKPQRTVHRKRDGASQSSAMSATKRNGKQCKRLRRCQSSHGAILSRRRRSGTSMAHFFLPTLQQSG